MLKRDMPYFTVVKGNHFGLEDLYFRMNETQVELVR